MCKNRRVRADLFFNVGVLIFHIIVSDRAPSLCVFCCTLSRMSHTSLRFLIRFSVFFNVLDARNELHLVRRILLYVNFFHLVKRILFLQNMTHENFPRVLTPTISRFSPSPSLFLSPPPSLSLSLTHALPLRRITSSRSRRVRVLLTGCHGNLATGLQWPKVDGLRAGAPEQTEQKSVHARTRSRMCVFVRLFDSLPPASSLSPPPSVAPWISCTRTYVCTWCLCLVSSPSRLPAGTLSRPTSAADSDTMEWDSIDVAAGEFRIKKKSTRAVASRNVRRASDADDESPVSTKNPDECRREARDFSEFVASRMSKRSFRDRGTRERVFPRQRGARTPHERTTTTT